MARLPILTFHTLADDGAVISFPPSLFVRCIQQLHACGYQTLRLDQAVALLRGGGGGEVKGVVLTFDDGYQSVYEEAFPILQRYGMTATVFVTTGPADAATHDRLPPLGGRPLLAWSELRAMQAADIEIGAHTVTHPDLTRLTPAQVETELAVSKARLEDGLGVAVTSFAYPFGRYNSTAAQVARRHFTCACSDRLGLASERSDLFALERLEMYYFRDARRLGLLTSPRLEWFVRLRGIPRTLRRAAARWMAKPAGA